MTGRRTRLPEPWARVDDGEGKIGALYQHPAGYTIQHCGHPTANYPYALWGPHESRADLQVMILAPNGMAWRHLDEAAAEVTRRQLAGMATQINGKAPALAEVPFSLEAEPAPRRGKQGGLF